MARSTIEDDRWALNNLHVGEPYRYPTQGVASHRYLDTRGIVHRAVWAGRDWKSVCDKDVEEKLQEGDAGAVTCLACLAKGA